MEKTVCELFAGVGGFRLGLEKASSDFETVWFSQWEPDRKAQWAHDCYVSHWGDIDDRTGTDIALVDKHNIPDHNLLVGGFPCQDYSVAKPLSASEGITGKKGVLWWQIRDILEVKRPAFVMLENVDRLIRSPKSQPGRDFGIILACFSQLDYIVEWRVINAANYGAAQKRRRLFIFAYHRDTAYAGQMKAVTPETILIKNGFFAETFPIVAATSPVTTAIGRQPLPALSDHFSFTFQDTGYMREGRITTLKATPVAEPFTPLGAVLEQDVPESYYVEDKLERLTYLKGAKCIERTGKSGHCYHFSEGAIAFPDPIHLPARTMLTSEGSINRCSHFICDPQTNRIRRLTPMEAERIQGFDDNWTIGMPTSMRYFCMGNALVVSLITRMGKTLSRMMDAA